MSEQVDRCVIRYWPDAPHNPIAIFFDQPEGNGLFNSYQRIGQHGGCSLGIVHDTHPCLADDPAAMELIQELKEIGYNPRVMRRIQR
jgi:hypothetical protein